MKEAPNILTHLHQVHWPTATIGILCLLILMGLRQLDRKIPAGAIMLGITAVIAYFVDYYISHSFHLSDSLFIDNVLNNVAVVGDAKGDEFYFSKWEWPSFNPGMMNNILPISFAVALLSVMEATSTAKSIAASSGQRLSTNQEIFGLGLGNLFSAFIGAMPVSGSPSRTTVNYENGKLV